VEFPGGDGGEDGEERGTVSGSENADAEFGTECGVCNVGLVVEEFGEWCTVFLVPLRNWILWTPV